MSLNIGRSYLGQGFQICLKYFAWANNDVGFNSYEGCERIEEEICTRWFFRRIRGKNLAKFSYHDEEEVWESSKEDWR